LCMRADETAAMQIQQSGPSKAKAASLEHPHTNEALMEELIDFKEAREHLLHFPSSRENDASHPFKCGMCVRQFAKRFNFEQHLLQHFRHNQSVIAGDAAKEEKQRGLTCLRCYGETFMTYSELWKHLISCYKNQAQGKATDDMLQLFIRNGLDINCEGQCWVCGSTAKHNQQIGLFHINTCVTCEAPYNSWLHHKQHVDEQHDGVMLVRCPHCAQVFATELELSRHKKQVHAKKKLNDEDSAGNRDVTCDQCGVIMKAKYLSHHRRNMHELHYDISCDICGKSGIRNKAYLQQHMYRNHSSEKKCVHCDFTTTIKLQMKRHMQRLHPDPGNLLKCAHCDYTHILESRIKNHIFTHHTDEKDRPYQCEVCNKGFGNSSVLRQHMFIHDNKRQFKCDKCTSAFNKKVNLTWHIRSVHLGEKRIKSTNGLKREPFVRHVVQ